MNLTGQLLLRPFSKAPDYFFSKAVSAEIAFDREKGAIESITLDREACHLKDELMPRYAKLIYNGFWFAPERLMLQALIDKSQERVEGKVRLKLYKGNVYVMGRESPRSLYSMAHVTFEEDSVYDQKDAQGFIKLNALRLRIGAIK